MNADAAFSPSLVPPHAPEPAPRALQDSRQRAMLQAMGITLWQPDINDKNTHFPDVSINKLAINNIVNSKQIQPSTQPSEHGLAASITLGTTLNNAPSIHSPVQRPVAQERSSAAAPTLPAAPAKTLQSLPSGITSMDWAQLQTAVSTCQACALCEGRKNPVFGTGQVSQTSAEAPLTMRADWLIVGEAPDESEDTAGEPFMGSAGKLLDNMLRAMVLDGQPLGRQNNVFLANVLKCRPATSRSPNAEEIATCQPYLLRQIELLQPKIIIAMGRFAVQSLLGSTEPLGKLRGRAHCLASGGATIPIIVTYHPAYLLRNLPDKAKAWADLMLAMETLQATS